MSTPLDPPDRPGSAGSRDAYLTARLVLAVTGLGASALTAAVLLRAAVPVLGWAALGLASIAVVDVVATLRRRHLSRRLSCDRHGTAAPVTYRR